MMTKHRLGLACKYMIMLNTIYVILELLIPPEGSNTPPQDYKNYRLTPS